MSNSVNPRRLFDPLAPPPPREDSTARKAKAASKPKKRPQEPRKAKRAQSRPKGPAASQKRTQRAHGPSQGDSTPPKASPPKGKGEEVPNSLILGDEAPLTADDLRLIQKALQRDEDARESRAQQRRTGVRRGLRF